MDVATEEGLSPGQQNGDRNDGVRENGDVKVKTERPPSRSGSSSNRSTPSLKSKEVSRSFSSSSSSSCLEKKLEKFFA